MIRILRSFKLTDVGMRRTFGFMSRLKAAIVHLGLTAVIAIIVAVIVFKLWYPWPYSVISGGVDLLLLILSVDLVLGPLMTFVVFNRSKSRAHLVRDIVVIVTLQLTGLGYGLYTIYLARPIAIVFEVDQFRVVSDAQVLHAELAQALPEFRALSLTGPKILSARRPNAGEEKLKAIDLALQGFDVGARPLYWQPYHAATSNILARARPLADLYRRYAKDSAEINGAVAKTGRTPEKLKFLPLMAKEATWSVLLDANTAEIVGFVPLDGYF